MRGRAVGGTIAVNTTGFGVVRKDRHVKTA
jgi:hypothetical protein